MPSVSYPPLYVIINPAKIREARILEMMQPDPELLIWELQGSS